MNKKGEKNIGAVMGLALCLMIIMTACGQQNDDVGLAGERTEIEGSEESRGDTDEDVTAALEQETSAVSEETDSGSGDAEAESAEDVLEKGQELTDQQPDYVGEERCSPYDFLEADDPWIIEDVESGKEFFSCVYPIRGLIGYSPVSGRAGGIRGYKKDREVIIEENVGRGLFQSERLAVVREEIKNIFIDIIRGRGEGAEEYLEYFSGPAVLGLEELKSFLETELEEDWILLQAPYLDEYAGNGDEVLWRSSSYVDGEIIYETVMQPAETESHYYFAYYFDADYRAMGYGEYDRAIGFRFNCAVSKETGLIDELIIVQGYESREGLENLRWDYDYGC